MSAQFVLTDYVEEALSQAIYDKLEDGTFAGRIPICKGVFAGIDLNKEPQREPVATL